MLSEIILFCLIVFLVLFFTFLCIAAMAPWSALALSLMLALIVLIVRYPPTLLISEVPSSMCTLYYMICGIVLIILFFYILSRCMQDRAGKCGGGCNVTRR